MRRLHLFSLLVVVAALGLISFVGTFLPHQMMMSNMMGGGFGGMSFFWPMALTASTTVVIIGIVYVIVFPSIRYTVPGGEEEEGTSAATFLDPVNIVMRVSKPDERAVLEVLRQSGGVCLQKDIVYQTRFSKVKTHRIIARLAERDVVLVKKSGKTNEISVPAWLRRESARSVSSD
jgi:uncharacterized membrane protein